MNGYTAELKFRKTKLKGSRKDLKKRCCQNGSDVHSPQSVHQKQ
jgi:hypothetical protein